MNKYEKLKKELDIINERLSDYGAEYKVLKRNIINIETEMVGLNKRKSDLIEEIKIIERNK